MQPSPIDLHASLPFINTLIEKHIFKSRQIKIGFVINRCVHQDERLDRVMCLLRFFRQFKTLGIMSESEVYQQPFMDKRLVDASDVDPKLWDNVIKWLD
ncbi:hypothetical protein [Vibrio campbellii]|uniref:hypothetical protein n=1 Tax=Vibrio campbellii TaxID=680 RepID=UPI001F2DA00F|nr:hypothetical protein [Vibrio campbellii]